jgi:EpsD family peptidyl-prolyl cis-trans isomerase
MSMTTSCSLAKMLSLSTLLLVAMHVLTGCGGEETKSATRVVAKVGSEDITVRMLDAVLSKKQGVLAGSADGLRRQVLDELIDQQLAIEQATKQKLDRSPEVVLAIELAQRDVVAQAYRDQMVRILPDPTDAEARKYYVEHPELFSNRRIYKLEEAVITSPDAPVAKLREMAAARRSAEDFRVFLAKQNARFVTSTDTLAAEQISMDVLPVLHTLKDGEIAVVEDSQAVRVLRVISSRQEPLDQRAALPGIRSFLAHQRATDMLKRDISQLRDAAKIEYLGEFAATSSPNVGAGDKRP